MKMLTATVVDGRLAVPEGVLAEGDVVTLLIPEREETFELDAEQRASLVRAIAEVERGEGVDGWELLAELREP